jgi:hypothetical protein
MSDIFISHSAKDGTPEAYRLVGELEATGLPCWIAPRDVKTGLAYPGQIVSAIHASRGLVLLLTLGANGSIHVLQEVLTAHDKRKLIVPVSVRGTQPSDNLKYLLAAPQQIAWTEPKATAAAVAKVFDKLC